MGAELPGRKRRGAGVWEGTMDYVQKYIDIGMFNADPEDHYDGGVLNSYLGERKAVFCTALQTLASTRLENGDEIGLMPFITEQTPCVLSVLNNAAVPEGAPIHDARQAMRDGRAFPQTNVGWENILSNIGQAYFVWLDQGYNVLTMTGAQAKELAKTGFDPAGDGNVYPYVLVTRGGEELDDDTT